MIELTEFIAKHRYKHITYTQKSQYTAKIDVNMSQNILNLLLDDRDRHK